MMRIIEWFGGIAMAVSLIGVIIIKANEPPIERRAWVPTTAASVPHPLPYTTYHRHLPSPSPLQERVVELELQVQELELEIRDLQW
jgi:hypothetical protein